MQLSTAVTSPAASKRSAQQSAAVPRHQGIVTQPVIPASPSRLSRKSPPQSSLRFASSASSSDQNILPAVQQSVSLLQQISNIPLHATRSQIGSSHGVQPVDGYTIGAQPNVLGSLIGTLALANAGSLVAGSRMSALSSGVHAVNSAWQASSLQRSQCPVKPSDSIRVRQGVSLQPDFVSSL